MILLERAKEIGVKVTASEVEKAMADIKSDYPDHEFQNSLIENAIPYPSWKASTEAAFTHGQGGCERPGRCRSMSRQMTYRNLKKRIRERSTVTSDPKEATASKPPAAKAMETDAEAAEKAMT